MPTLSGANDPAIVIGEKFVELIRDIPEIENAKVHFALGHEIQPEELPCISVELGPDTPTDPDGTQMSAFTNSLQTIYIDLYDKANNKKGLYRIAKQRALCHYAIMDDWTLGLAPMVIQTRYGGASDPVVDEESGLPGWTMRAMFVVHYKFNEVDRTVVS